MLNEIFNMELVTKKLINFNPWPQNYDLLFLLARNLKGILSFEYILISFFSSLARSSSSFSY